MYKVVKQSGVMDYSAYGEILNNNGKKVKKTYWYDGCEVESEFWYENHFEGEGIEDPHEESTEVVSVFESLKDAKKDLEAFFQSIKVM